MREGELVCLFCGEEVGMDVRVEVKEVDVFFS